MRLSDFFQPLIPLNIFIYIGLFLFFDVLGFFIYTKVFKLKIKTEYRLVNWLTGLGTFIFLWFIASLVYPYTQKNIMFSIVFLLTISLGSYIKLSGFKSLLETLWKAKIPVLITLPFLPAVFIKASLPPYYGDEMAYHYISPYTLLHLEKIKYIGGLYADLPRILNLFWEVIFSLTHTYSIARLFHFTILATGLIYAFNILKKNFKLIAGFLFVLLFLSLPQDIVLTSTLGYIDVGAFTFLLMGLVSAIDFIRKPAKESLFLVVIFWAMNLGTKYTGLTAFVSFLISFGLLVICNSKKYKRFFSLKLTTCYILLFMAFGGYWYIKNFILFGNPIFPFLFSCWGNHVEPCGQGGAFFGSWTTKVNFENARQIVSQLFIKQSILQILVFITPVFALFLKDKVRRSILFVLVASVVIEISYLKYFSGFYIRYHQHLQLILLIGIVISLLSESKVSILNVFRKILLTALVIYSLVLYASTVKFTNSLKFLNLTEITYAIRRINIYDWIHFNFFDMKEVISFCEDGNEINLARYDPDQIWFTHDGLSRVFMLGCNYVNPDIDTSSLENVISSAVKNKQQFWIVSTSKCQKREDVKPKFEYELPYQFYLRQVNNELICNSSSVKNNLYYFDYQHVKF